ncbi:MAG TPA: hypothetical protein VJU77_04045 [Chthoniobacterales bacterium]|nr:hypothetical protein [Chthoniobacterales bacterium]
MEDSRFSPSDTTLRRWWHRHAYILPSFFVSLIVWCWFVTWGDWKFFQPEEFCGFYDAYARSILHGHFDVPRSAIGLEAFTFEGKTYGYFGIAPALLRIPLVLIFPNMDGQWSRVMMLAAAMISLICAYALLRMFHGSERQPTPGERVLHSIFIVSAGVGSTVVFLIGRSYTFHEALMWSGAFALLFAWALARYFQRPQTKFLLLAAAFSFMSFHSRATTGAGAVLAMAIVAAVLAVRASGKPAFAAAMFGLGKVERSGRQAAIALAAVAITAAIYFGVGYAKFKTFEPMPMRYYDFYNQFPIRMRITQGKQLHLRNVPSAIATYFGVHGFRIKDDFPWLYPEEEQTVIGWPRNDVIEPFSTVPVSMPALSLLAVIGIAALGSGSNESLKRARLPAVALFAGGSLVLATVGVTGRYLHDFYPALIMCAAAGVARLGSSPRLRSINALAAVLAAVSIVLNCSFSFIHQRKNFDTSEQLQQRVNSILKGD